MSHAANDDAAGLLRLVSENDLLAYAGGDLEPSRRREVEGYLACNPDLAARVMGALHRSRPAVRRRRRRLSLTAGFALALGACAASAFAAWNLEDRFEATGAWRTAAGRAAPAYVEEAVMSHRATMIRASMVSQPETPTLDAAEVSREMNLHLPALPHGWRLVDVQVFPSDDGPGVNMFAKGADGRGFSLFAVRADTPASGPPALASRDGQHAAFWEHDGAAFVLTGDASAPQLLGAANKLAGS